MNVVIVSQKLRNRSEQSDDSDIEELQESDWSSDLESLEDDSIEERRLFDELGYIDQFICDNDTGEEDRTFQPITNPYTSDTRPSPFQHCQPIPIKPLQVRIPSPPHSLESDSDSLSSFTDYSSSPGSPCLIQRDILFPSTKRVYNSSVERGFESRSTFDTSFSRASILDSYSYKMPSISSSSAGIELRRFSSSSVFRVYSRADYNSNLYWQPARPFQIRSEQRLSAIENPEASLDSTRSSPTDLSDDEVSDVFSENTPMIFTSTPPLYFRPISRCSGVWEGLDDDDERSRCSLDSERSPWSVDEDRTGWSVGQRAPAMWTNRTRNHLERTSGVRRWSRAHQTRFSSSDINRTAVIQRPSLDFDKMQKSSFGRKHVLNGVTKPRVVKVKNFRSSSCYKSASQLFDPTVFCFRSLSLRHDYRSPAPSPGRRIVHSAPPGVSSEGLDSPSSGRGFQTINHVDMSEPQMFHELNNYETNQQMIREEQAQERDPGLRVSPGQAPEGRLEPKLPSEERPAQGPEGEPDLGPGDRPSQVQSGQHSGEQSKQGQKVQDDPSIEANRISGDLISGHSTINSLVICDLEMTSESVHEGGLGSSEFSSNNCMTSDRRFI